MFQLNQVPKPNHKRNKPKRKQRGHIYDDVRKQLYERSGGVCERCGKARGAEAAHTLRRDDIRYRTTVEDLAHLCVPCHRYCDGSDTGGKVFKQTFREAAYRRAGREKEFYM